MSGKLGPRLQVELVSVLSHVRGVAAPQQQPFRGEQGQLLQLERGLADLQPVLGVELAAVRDQLRRDLRWDTDAVQAGN